MGPLRRVARALVVALATSFATLPAFAQQDDGWLDQQASAPASAAPAAAGSDKAPLAPSPLLEQGAATADEDDSLDRDPRALTYWNSHLAPYGLWVDDPSYGRVWVPHSHVAGSDFAPYVSGGHWALDENEEWLWVSDYPFGGITFHYGRWVWISGRGWAWIPGLRYAPAWVAWRTPVGSYGYVGWAPLPPAWVWFGGVSVVYSYGPYYPWVFCSSDYLFYPHVHHYIIRDRHRMTHAASHTRPYYRTAAPYHRTASARPVAAPRSPTTREANVPPRAVPRQRIKSERLVAPAPRRAESSGLLGSRIPPGQRAGSAAPARSERAPLLDHRDQRRVPAQRRDVAPAQRREAAPAQRQEAAPAQRRAPAFQSRPATERPPRAERPRFERERPSVEPRRMAPQRELRSAPHGRSRSGR